MPRAKVRDYMTEKIVSVRPDAPFKEVVELLTIYDISGVPVTDDDGRLLGMITEADLLAKEADTGQRRPRLLALLTDLLHGRKAGWARKAEGRTAQEIMSTPVVSTTPGEELRRAAKRMIGAKVKRLPVVEGGAVVGMLSRHDLMHAFDRPDADLKATVERFLRECLFVEPEAHVEVSVDDGVATLDGSVHFESDRRVAEALVASVDGIVGVENHLRFREPDPRLQPL